MSAVRQNEAHYYRADPKVMRYVLDTIPLLAEIVHHSLTYSSL